MSNEFGLEAWNNAQTLTNAVKIIASNRVSVLFTNNYNWGTNFTIVLGTNQWVAGWPAHSTRSYIASMLPNLEILPLSMWSDLSHRMFSPDDSHFDGFENTFVVHNWELDVTNYLAYTLIDTNATDDRVLDFVNVGPLGSSLNLNQVITQFPQTPSDSELPSYDYVWLTNGANDLLSSPPSLGVLNQLRIAQGELDISDWPPPGIDGSPYIALFNAFLNGQSTNAAMDCPFQPAVMFAQNFDCSATNPKVHYTIEDLTNGIPSTLNVFDPAYNPPRNFGGSLGARNPNYRSATPYNAVFSLTGSGFQIDFTGVSDLPYIVWRSTNLVDWVQAGTATQFAPGIFNFSESLPTNSSARFYQVMAP